MTMTTRWGKGWKSPLRLHRLTICQTCGLGYRGAGGGHRASAGHEYARRAARRTGLAHEVPRRPYSWVASA